MKSRQKIRMGIILVSFFIFPAIFYYMSPYLIVVASSDGIVNGSFIFFLSLFVLSLVLGRGFCGWLCPGAGCQEALSHARNKSVTKGNFIKWMLWISWVAAIIFVCIKAGGYREVQFFYRTTHGFSIGNLQGMINYLLVLMLIVLPALIFGRRSFCHHICWMAPFMILGRSLRNVARWPALQLKTEPDLCTECRKCSKNCPMSLPVHSMVKSDKMESLECILCGSCADNCKQRAIRFSFR
ncbi:MAG: 4Fe-4S binding protein [Acidobacteriota bacterium]